MNVNLLAGAYTVLYYVTCNFLRNLGKVYKDFSILSSHSLCVYNSFKIRKATRWMFGGFYEVLVQLCVQMGIKDITGESRNHC